MSADVAGRPRTLEDVEAEANEVTDEVSCFGPSAVGRRSGDAARAIATSLTTFVDVGVGPCPV